MISGVCYDKFMPSGFKWLSALSRFYMGYLIKTCSLLH